MARSQGNTSFLLLRTGFRSYGILLQHHARACLHWIRQAKEAFTELDVYHDHEFMAQDNETFGDRNGLTDSTNQSIRFYKFHLGARWPLVEEAKSSSRIELRMSGLTFMRSRSGDKIPVSQYPLLSPCTFCMEQRCARMSFRTQSCLSVRSWRYANADAILAVNVSGLSRDPT